MGEALAETRKVRARAETHSRYRDVCVLIPRPGRPLFIGFRCRILRQTSSHRVPPFRRRAHSLFFFPFFLSLSLHRIASRRSLSRRRIYFSLLSASLSPIRLFSKHPVNPFAKTCRASINWSDMRAGLIGRMQLRALPWFPFFYGALAFPFNEGIGPNHERIRWIKLTFFTRFERVKRHVNIIVLKMCPLQSQDTWNTHTQNYMNVGNNYICCRLIDNSRKSLLFITSSKRT